LFIAVVWSGVAGFGLFGLLLLTGALESGGTDPAGRGISQGFGCILMVIAAAAGGAMLLGIRWRGWVYVGAAILALPLIVGAIFGLFGMREQARYERETADRLSGKADFGNQPPLLAVAEAIARNDPEAIRAAAQNVPDLNASGEEGKTLLYFAVDRALEHPEFITAVQALLSLGADPNFNNGQLNSFAMWRAVSGTVDLLRAMLDAGGNPNGPDLRGNPIIFSNWEMTFNETERPARFRLLLDRGVDVNSAYPTTAPFQPGYSLLLARVNPGRGDHAGYADAIELLERGADPKHSAVDGTNLVQMLQEHRQYFAATEQDVPREFQALWDWLLAHDLLPKDA
jgi:hypothetical protein